MSGEQPERGVSAIGTDRSVGTERDVLKGPLSILSHHPGLCWTLDSLPFPDVLLPTFTLPRAVTPKGV